jgi:hypothetical protein
MYYCLPITCLGNLILTSTDERSQTGDIEAAAKAVGVKSLNPESSDSFGG